jgi:hypothetical protein
MAPLQIGQDTFADIYPIREEKNQPMADVVFAEFESNPAYLPA